MEIMSGHEVTNNKLNIVSKGPGVRNGCAPARRRGIIVPKSSSSMSAVRMNDA